jgi:hypothetical protein
MAMNRIQFQHGLSMPEFLRDYGTEAQCERVLEVVRWPNEFFAVRVAVKRRTTFCAMVSARSFSATRAAIKPR